MRMLRVVRVAVITVVSLPTVCLAQARMVNTAADAVPPPAVTEDAGTFRITQNGVALGTERFRLHSDGGQIVARSEIDYSTDRKHVRQSADLHISAAGALEWYVWDEGKSKINVQYTDGRVASHYLPESGDPRDFFFVMPPATSILDSNFYAHWALLASRYNVARGGTQEYPVFVPHSGDPGKVTLTAVQDQGGPGAPLHLRASTDEATLDLFLQQGRLQKIVIADANIVVERSR